MSRAFDKFGWLRALREDPFFTDKEARLGMAICTDFVWRDGTGWHVDLDELAASVPGNMSRNWLKAALQKFIRHGYLIETGRTGGGRGQGGRRSHNLLPQPAKPASAQGRASAETRPATGASIGGETRPCSGANPPLQDDKPAPAAGRKVSAEVGKGTPQGVTQGSSSGGACAREASPTPEAEGLGDDSPEDQPDPFAAAAYAAPPNIAALPPPLTHRPNDYPEPEPPQRCPEHVDWDTDRRGRVPNCPPCGDARKAHEAWCGRRDQWPTKVGRDRRKWVKACRECDDEDGAFLGPDRKPVDPLVRCPHAAIWCAWWKHHLALPRCDPHADVPLADALGCPDCERAANGGRREAS